MKKHSTSQLFLKVALGAALICVTGTSFAQSKKKSRPGDSGVEEELRLKSGDETGNELKALKTEVLVMNSEKKALAQLLALQKKYENTRMEPEVLFRLAEIYMRRARTDRFFEVHRNSEQVMSFAPTLVKEASEAAEIRRAISYYGRIQEKYPAFRFMDIVYFNNAYAYQQVGENKNAEALYSRLIQKYPRSPLVPDAYLSIGEINYHGRNFKVALENFRALKKYPKARAYPYGIYKAAWAYYNLQDAASAIKQLEEVVAFGREVARLKLDSKLDLRKEALSDLALFFGETMPAARAVDYFMAQSAELDASVYVLRLAELYKRHSRFNDVETVLKDVLVKMPKSDSVPMVHDELIANYDRTKRHNGAVEQLVAFDAYCESTKPAPPKNLKKGETAPRAACEDKVADTSKRLALKWHAYWKKAGGVEGGKSNITLSASTEKAYRQYLKTAAVTDPELATMRFALGELAFARGEFREASALYAAVEQDQKSGGKVDTKIAHDASYGAIVALERAVKDKWNDEDEKSFQALTDSYVKRFPEGQYVLELKFKRAFIAYEKERYDEAAPQLRAIGWMDLPENAPTPERVLKAQDLYLDILNIKKDYKTLREAAQLLLNKKPSAQRVVTVEKIYREAYFAEIQQLEEKGKLAEAVEAYKKFALENTSSDLASKAWWNASQLQFRMGDAQGGANTCYQMHKLFPKSSNGKDCLTQAAQTFESMGRLDLASRVLLNLAMVESDKQNKWREVAADFFALSGSRDRAIQMYMKLAEGKAKEVQLPLLEKAAQTARDSNDQKTLAQIEALYTKMNIEPQASRLVVEQAEAAFEKGDHTTAFNVSKRIIARESLPKDLLARARYLQARVLEDEYRKQSVKAKVERVGIVLALKTEKLEKAQKAYQSAIRYADPATSVKSLRRLADCYIDYAKTVRAMQLPASVPAPEQDAFKKEIEQLAMPMEEKGIESMAQALDAAKKAQLRDGEIAELQAEVNRLNLKPSTAPAMMISAPSIYVPQFNREISANKEVGL